MKRTQILTVLAGLGLLFASTANAALSVVLTPTATTAVQGGTITLNTIATQNGSETDNTIFGAINFNDALVNSNIAGNSQVPLMTSIGALTCTTAFCVAFSQVNAAAPISVNITNQNIATTTFIADAPVGTVINFAWRTTPTTQRFDWFGLTNGVPPSVNVTVIPEPTTVALLGLGLVGLAVAGRRRA